MGVLRQRLCREFPQTREGRIEQLGAAVAAEHRDGFGEIVERLALDTHQPVILPLELQAFGDIVEQIG